MWALFYAPCLNHLLFQFSNFRAELSAQKKECMMNKLKEMELNVALTNDTLTKAQERIDKQDEIRSMVDTMKDKIKNYEVKLNKQKQNSQQLGILGECNPDFDFPTPLIDYDEEEKKETQQNVETQIDQKLSSTKEDKKAEDSTLHQKSKLFINIFLLIVKQGFEKIGLPQTNIWQF